MTKIEALRQAITDVSRWAEEDAKADKGKRTAKALVAATLEQTIPHDVRNGDGKQLMKVYSSIYWLFTTHLE